MSKPDDQVELDEPKRWERRDVKWCTQCLAAGFHRIGCPKKPKDKK